MFPQRLCDSEPAVFVHAVDVCVCMCNADLWIRRYVRLRTDMNRLWRGDRWTTEEGGGVLYRTGFKCVRVCVSQMFTINLCQDALLLQSV